ncbi:MAG: hypothetical protein K5765_08830 [Clostridia bacterium]|nr:hypothetical protein [Clostridia bacterium]
MKKVLTVFLHILLFPALLGVVLWFNWDVIYNQTKNYGIFPYVGLIVAALCCIVYYIVYAIVTRKRKNAPTKKTKSRQTKKLCATIAIMMCGLWMVVDIVLPDILSDLTSSTVYYEDLTDDWNTRFSVNKQLLNDFVELSYNAGVLPKVETTDEDGNPTYMNDEDAIAYYQSKGIKENLPELSENEYYQNIDTLFTIQFQNMDAKGYSAFRHPWIDFATSDRLTIPCIIHLLLDDMPINQEKVKKLKEEPYVKTETKVVDGEEVTEVTEVMFVVCDKNTKEIRLENVSWSVLDMLGEDTSVMDLATLDVELLQNKTILGMLIKPAELIFERLSNILESEDLLNYRIVVKLSTGGEVYPDMKTVLTLGTMDEVRGVMGYQNMAWLDSNGLLYAVASVFSLRYIFLIFAAYGVLINILIGLCRGAGKEEKEERRILENLPTRRIATKIPEDDTYPKVSGPNAVIRENYYGSQYIK